MHVENLLLMPVELIDHCCVAENTYRWQVDHGKTYLLRLVNAAMNAELYFAIAQHVLTVVGLDGSYLKPVVTEYVMISPGQTMDILVTANQTRLGRYYMAARQFDSVRPDDTDYDHINVTAILEYRGNYTPTSTPIFPSSLPTYQDIKSAIYFTDRLRSLADQDHPVNVPKNITTMMYISVSMNSITFDYEGTSQSSLSSSLNNVSWVNPTTDVLLAYYRYFFFPIIFLMIFSHYIQRRNNFSKRLEWFVENFSNVNR